MHPNTLFQADLYNAMNAKTALEQGYFIGTTIHFFTRKVNTIIFIDWSKALSPSKNDKTTYNW